MELNIINAVDNVIERGDEEAANYIFSNISRLTSLKSEDKEIISQKIVLCLAGVDVWQQYPDRARVLICIVKELGFTGLTRELILEEFINSNQFSAKIDAFWRFFDELFGSNHPDTVTLANHLFKNLVDLLPDMVSQSDYEIINPEIDVLIITQQFLTLNHAPTRDTLNYIKELHSIGREVDLLVTNEAMPEKVWFYQPHIRPDLIGPFDIEIEGRNVLGLGLKHAQTLENIESVVNFYKKRNPKLIISVGAYSIYAESLGRHAKLITIPLSVEFFYSKYSNILLWFSGQNSRLKEIKTEYNIEHLKVITSINYQYTEPKFGVKITKDELGLEPNGKTGIIVGNRLDLDLDGEALNFLEKLMKLHQINLIVVGKIEEDLKSDLSSLCNERIKFIGFHENLIDLFAVADFFLNPKRLGGGTSAAHALSVGVLVFTLNFGDVSKIAIPECIFDSYEDMLGLGEIVVDEVKFIEYRDKSIAKFKEISDKKSMLIELINLSQES
jgi:hypothetical protein